MDIGAKLKAARLEAGLTQEKAAEALGVSRQTISNWEHEKTYPDIVSVVKMSDLYGISLDRLLKGEDSMSKYVDYLEESTNVVSSRERFSRLLVVLVYLVIWAFSVLFFWLCAAPDDAMGYGIMFLWVVLPVAAFAVSVVIGLRDYWGVCKWYSAIGFGVMYMMAEYATFSAANMASFGHVNPPEVGMIVAGGIISAAGMGVGSLVRRIGQRRMDRQNIAS